MEETLGMISLFGYHLSLVKSYVGLGIEFIVVLLLGVLLRSKRSSLKIAFEMFFEFMYNFFEEILGKQEKKWIKGTIVSIFFVVFIANLLGWLGDILAQGFGFMETRFSAFTSDRNGVFGMSLLIVLCVLIINVANNGRSAGYNYFPVWGKGYLTLDKKEGGSVVGYRLGFIFIKLADIVISLFIGFLDFVGDFIAKPISLAFRLYGNMFAGTILLGLLVGASSNLTAYLLHGFKFPVLLPLILFVQGLLVAIIQAFVVALLTAIFVKMTQTEEAETS